MKQRFRDWNPSVDSIARVKQVNTIISQYKAQGLKLTLRQLYYQLVSRNLLPNTARSYKNLGSTVSDGRLAGLIDWEAIEDRGRRPRRPSEFDNLSELVDAAVASYRLPRWKGQTHYCELWVEKDALASILEPMASEYHVTMLVNRGFSSQSAMYEAAQRFMHGANQPESDYFDDTRDVCKPVLFYLGDHDPSGMNMVDDISKRLEMFGVNDLDVQRIAITMAQARQYKAPPNVAKRTDSRFKEYVRQCGTTDCWEVDALPPNVLQQLITDAFEQVIDDDKMQAIKDQEEEDKLQLKDFAAKVVGTKEDDEED